MYRGTVGNPLSQRAYAWVGNNPLANSDPSRFVTSCPGGTLNEGGGVCSPAGGSSTLFPGPFGGGGGGTASFGPTIIRRQAAACPPGGAKTAATIGLSGAGSIIVIGVGANLSANLQLNVAGANSNISLSLQAAGGLGGGAYVGAGGGLVGGIGGSVPAPGFSTDYGSYLEGDAGWGPSGSFSTSQSASSTSLQVSPPWFGPLSRLGVGAGAGAGRLVAMANRPGTRRLRSLLRRCVKFWGTNAWLKLWVLTRSSSSANAGTRSYGFPSGGWRVDA